MINLFRKIRKNLSSENKIGKYLLYASGEIILVVIGILIAIQLNSWKTETDENAEVLNDLNGLYAELNQDSERMDTLYAFYADKTDAIQRLLEYNDTSVQLSNHALGELFNSILEYKKFSSKRSTYLSMISGGYINKIKYKDLINEIIKYYESPYLTWSTEIYGNISESIDYSQTEIYHSNDGLIRLKRDNSIPNWTLNNDQYKSDYAKLVQSKWAIDILTNFLKQSNFIFINLKNYKELNDHLRKEIKEYTINGIND